MGAEWSLQVVWLISVLSVLRHLPHSDPTPILTMSWRAFVPIGLVDSLSFVTE